MSKVYRYDRGEYRKAVRLDNGVLRVEAVPTKAGVFSYRNADGSIRRELRSEDEVFRADSLMTLEGGVITLGHPVGGTVRGKVREMQRGHLGTDVARDGHLVKATAFVTDTEAQAAAENGTARELSCGYRCDVLDEPGVHPTFGDYTHVQKNIRYDHVALLPKGRAGGDVRLHLDAADDAEMISDDSTLDAEKDSDKSTNSRNEKMKKIRIDGVDYEVSEQAAQAVEKMTVAKDAEVLKLAEEKDVAEKTAETERARADAAEAAKAEIQARLDKADGPETIQAAVKARLDLEREAGKILPKETKLDEMDDAAIKKAVVAATLPTMRLDEDVSSERLDVAYEAALAHYEQMAKLPHVGLGDLRRRVDSAIGGDNQDPIEKARAANKAKAQEAFKNHKPSISK
jgi:hypothetical protein